MTNELVRIPDPYVGTTRQLAERIVDARSLIARLEGTLRHIDELREVLREQGTTVDVDLGPIGNSAAVARRQVVAGESKTTFALPVPKAS